MTPAKWISTWKALQGKSRLLKMGWGCPLTRARPAQILKEKEIKVIIDLQQGKEEAYVWTCDLSYEYVRINAEYRS